jgi:hypothetical protein
LFFAGFALFHFGSIRTLAIGIQSVLCPSAL